MAYPSNTTGKYIENSFIYTATTLDMCSDSNVIRIVPIVITLYAISTLIHGEPCRWDSILFCKQSYRLIQIGESNTISK